MNLKRVFLLALCVCCLLIGVSDVVECALPFGIFPLLTSGWYYKPNPVESVIFGLIVVKILAIRLASVTGILPIPYHLNDLFARSLGKRSIVEYFPSGIRNLKTPLPNSSIRNQSYTTFDMPKPYEASILPIELNAMYRLLLSVRRLDTSDCFLKSLCVLGQQTASSNDSLEDHLLSNTIRYLTLAEKKVRNATEHLSKPSIMDVFYNALSSGMKEAGSNSSQQSNCASKYSMCPLADSDINFDSIISDMS